MDVLSFCNNIYWYMLHKGQGGCNGEKRLIYQQMQALKCAHGNLYKHEHYVNIYKPEHNVNNINMDIFCKIYNYGYYFKYYKHGH